MTKILIIGQAPALKTQKLPYDSTMLYIMLEWIGITKEKAQTMFEFEAISNIYNGSKNGKHIKPTKEQMNSHWVNTLETKVQAAEKIWLIGNVAKEYFHSKPKTWSCNLEILETIHPSRINWFRIMPKKDELTEHLKNFINDQ